MYDTSSRAQGEGHGEELRKGTTVLKTIKAPLCGINSAKIPHQRNYLNHSFTRVFLPVNTVFISPGLLIASSLILSFLILRFILIKRLGNLFYNQCCNK